MACNDKKKFSTSEASTKASLRTKGAIDKFLNILDYNKFNTLNNQWSQDAKERFNIKGRLFSEEDNKAVPNKNAFKAIDNAKGIFYQEAGVKPSVASPEILSRVKEVLKKMNVDVQDLTTYAKNNPEVDVTNLNGIADLTTGIIAISEGKEEIALTEEMVHIATAIIEQKNPKLITELISKIDRFKIYKDVLAEYKNLKAYQLPNGKPDIRKIKKEAVDKLISELIINESETYPEVSEEENASFIRRMWNVITDWFRGQYKQSNINIFSETAEMVLGGDFEGDVLGLDSAELYYQITDAQKELQQKIADTKSSLRKIESNEPINPLLMDEENATSYYEVLVDGKFERVTKRVTDRVKSWYRQRFGDKTFTAQEKKDNEVKRSLGVTFHNFFEEIHARFFNEDGTRRSNPGPRPNITDPIDDEVYTKLEKYYTDLISEFSKDGKSPLVFSELMVYDSKQKEAGTIDLLIVDQDGKSHIYDWKFMSIAQNAEDVPWYKQGAYGVQLGRYKQILRDEYGVKEIGKNRAVPIIMDLKRENPQDATSALKLKGIKIGSINPKDVESLTITPVSEKFESTGIKKLDDLIKKLNAVYEQVSKSSPTNEEDRTFKRERLNILRLAIRSAQSGMNIAPLVEVVRVMRKEGENIIAEYKNSYENRPATSEDYKDRELSDFSDNIREYLDLAAVFEDINVDLKDLIEDENLINLIRSEAEAIKISRRDIKNISEEFADKFIGEKNLVTGLTDPEKVVKGLASLFRGLSELPLASLKLLYKLSTRALGFASQDALVEVNGLLEIRDKLKARGGDLRQIVKGIYQKDTEGNLVNKLIYRYQKAFYEGVDENAKEGRRSRKWLRDNVDLKAYAEEASKILKERLSKIEKTYDEGQLKEKLILEEVRKWDVSRSDFNGFNNYVIKRHPLPKWESSEYIALKQDTDLFELYTYISEINEKAKDVGYIQNKAASTFLPFVRKSMAESLAWDFSLSSISNFSKNLSVRASDVGYGNINELTGEVENSIPKYYTTDFTKGEDGVNDYSDVSEDLFKNMILYINHMERYKYMSEVEGQIKLVRTVETFKDHLETTRFSKVVIGDDGKPVREKGNTENVKTFDQFLRTVFYGQKYAADDSDVALGDGVLNGVKKGINSVAGKEVFKTDDKPGSVSLVKTMDAMNRAFQLKTLGFEFISGAVNIFGGNIQVATQAGNYFKAREFAKNEMMLIGNRFKNDDERKMFIQLIDKFMPLKDDPTYDKLQKAGMSKLTQQNFSDLLFVFFRQPEQHLEKSVFYTLLDNMMVEDGKIVSIREFVKNKYKDRYSSAATFRDSKKLIDAEIEELKKSRSINATKTLEDGELVIPGLDLNNREELQRLTNLSRSISKNATGNLTDADVSKMNMSVWTRSMMVFKGWIPKLVDTRFGEFRKVSDDFSLEIGEDGLTTGDKYDIGRIRLFASFLNLNIARSVKDILDVIKVSEDGLLKLDEMYNDYANTYFERTGKTLNMSKEDFNDLIRNNLRNQVKELAILMSLFGAMLSLGFMEPDDDADKATKNFYRFSQRVVDKFTSELMFFYNPADMKSVLSGGLLPAIGIFTDIGRFTDHFFMETTGLDFSNPDLTMVQVRKKAQPVKNLMKMFPVSKSLVTYLAILNSEFAKEFDVTIQKQSRR